MQHGFPYLSGGGRLVLKDVILLAGGLLIMADSARAFLEARPSAQLQTMTASRTSTAPAEAAQPTKATPDEDAAIGCRRDAVARTDVTRVMNIMGTKPL